MKAATADIKMVIIRNGEAKVNLFATILPIETGKPAGHYALVFHQYGDRYFLWGMKIEGTRVMYQLPESKAEMELRAQNVPATERSCLPICSSAGKASNGRVRESGGNSAPFHFLVFEFSSGYPPAPHPDYPLNSAKLAPLTRSLSPWPKTNPSLSRITPAGIQHFTFSLPRFSYWGWCWR